MYALLRSRFNVCSSQVKIGRVCMITAEIGRILCHSAFNCVTPIMNKNKNIYFAALSVVLMLSALTLDYGCDNQITNFRECSSNWDCPSEQNCRYGWCESKDTNYNNQTNDYCGDNAYRNSEGGCSCNIGYGWCADNYGNLNCCLSTNKFSVHIYSAQIQPYKNKEDLEPWDWDGSIPGWLLDGLSILAHFYPELEVWVEVLDAVDQYAPAIMDGYVPPDPFFGAYVGGGRVGGGSVVDDTYEPEWNSTFEVTVDNSTPLRIKFWDSDLFFDDFIQTVEITLSDLRAYSNTGIVNSRVGRLYNLQWVVSPVWQ